jgi:UDP-N-acetylglucosamine 2-epimerase (non-hydrolysing)
MGRDAVTVCVTGQHRDLLDQVLSVFDIRPDFDLDLMRYAQTPAYVLSACITRLTEAISGENFSNLIVHGDTSTTLGASLAAFHSKVPCTHIEAGLRSFDFNAPWPEEMNRTLVSRLCTYHFAPTERAARNLRAEGVDAGKIWVTGNTVVDALLLAQERLVHDETFMRDFVSRYPFISSSRPIILVTAHRRENHGAGLTGMCEALLEIVEGTDAEVVFPVHPNPSVSRLVFDRLASNPRIHLIAPLSYPDFVYFLSQCRLVLTDSGGVQEEAPSFNKPVLVMRDVTERPEAVEAGCARLIGMSRGAISAHVLELLTDHEAYERMSAVRNPFGDGHACKRITSTLIELFGVQAK